MCCDVRGITNSNRKFQWVELMSANVLQTAWVHWRVSVLFFNNFKLKRKWSSQLWSNLSSYKQSPEKILRLQQDSNPWPPRYRCDDLTTELWSLHGSRSVASHSYDLYHINFTSISNCLFKTKQREEKKNFPHCFLFERFMRGGGVTAIYACINISNGLLLL